MGQIRALSRILLDGIAAIRPILGHRGPSSPPASGSGSASPLNPFVPSLPSRRRAHGVHRRAASPVTNGCRPELPLPPPSVASPPTPRAASPVTEPWLGTDAPSCTSHRRPLHRHGNPTSAPPSPEHIFATDAPPPSTYTPLPDQSRKVTYNMFAEPMDLDEVREFVRVSCLLKTSTGS